MQTAPAPRSTFPHGNDCELRFLRRADNQKAYIDVWEIQVRGEVFILQMMQLKRRGSPWVFGSFSLNDQPVWNFRGDVRVKAGFRGNVYTQVWDEKTYVIFENYGKLVHIVPFVAFLHDPTTQAVDDAALLSQMAEASGLSVPGKLPRQQPVHQNGFAAPRTVEEQHDWFFKRVLARMG